MMPPDRRIPEQLDVPLVWELEPSPALPPRDDDPFPQPPRAMPAGAGRLLMAVLADAGVLVAFVGCGWATAVACGTELNPLQLVLAGGLGLEVATVVATACLMGWRATPGMLLAGVEVADPLALARATGVWAVWVASLPLLGLPLIVGRRGKRLLERLAAAPAILRSRSATS